MDQFELDFEELDASIADDRAIEINRLVSELTEGSQKYYSTGTSPYSDKEWDLKYQQLSKLDPNNPILEQVGHGYDIDDELDETGTTDSKFEHPIIAGSIPKTKDIKLIKNKIGKKSTFSVKLDGNAMFLYYRKGELAVGATRGRDNIGIDKTYKMKTIVPLSIPVDLDEICVKGEAIISKEEYTADNGFNIDISSRNTVAGLLNKQDGWSDQFKFIKFIPYIFVDTKTKKNIEHDYEWNKWFEIESQKDAKIFIDMNIDEFYEKYKVGWKYPCDGTVFRFDDSSMLALKYDDEVGNANTKRIVFTIGIDQRLTPVVHFEPTRLAGATIRKASVGSFNKLNSLGLWPFPEKATIEFIRANEIIPKVVSAKVIEHSNEKYTLPKCPVCGSESSVEGKHVFCRNPECANIEDSKLYKFAQFYYPKGLSDNKAENLFKAHKIKTIYDLLKFNYKKYDYTRIDGIGVADNILIMAFFDNLSGDIDSKHVYQSMITSCGKTYAKQIVNSGFKIKNIANPDEYHHLTELKGMPDKVILELEKEAARILRICELRNVVDKVPKNVVGSYCITTVRFSQEQVNRLESLGWVDDGTVKKTTTVLITSDIDNITGKVAKAKKYGIDVVEIQQFFDEYIDIDNDE